MRWANKVLSNNQDNSQSKLSNRSSSRFKKVNLQKSEHEISSNCNLQKSVLKLTSVQKINPATLNRSFISNYVNLGPNNGSQASRDKYIQKSSSQLLNSNNKNQNMQSSKSEQMFFPKFLDFGLTNQPGPIQGFGIFQKETNKTQSNDISMKSSLQKNTHQDTPLKEKFESILDRIREVMTEFNHVVQKLKLQINITISTQIMNLSTQISKQIQEFSTKIQTKFFQLINLTNKSSKQSIGKFQNLVKTDQILPPSPDNESFYKIKYFDHLQAAQNQAQKHQLTSRPNTFKNKFKQIIDNSNENFLSKDQVSKNCFIVNEQSSEKLSRKIIRKQTNPVQRVNSLLRNDSSVLNQNSFNRVHNDSTSSIKYCKINDRSASKSVKKLHDKIVLIKNIFNSTSSSTNILKNEEANLQLHNK